jgi:hypothetical protein
MESINNIDPFELGMVGIVFFMYIVGKVWMYYRIETPNKENPKQKPVIKRGTEWEE